MSSRWMLNRRGTSIVLMPPTEVDPTKRAFYYWTRVSRCCVCSAITIMKTTSAYDVTLAYSSTVAP